MKEIDWEAYLLKSDWEPEDLDHLRDSREITDEEFIKILENISAHNPHAQGLLAAAREKLHSDL